MTGTFRDMTQIRFEFPKFIPENCTGCAKCWSQCPDTAIPGLIVHERDILKTAAKRLGNGTPSALAGVVDQVAERLHKKLAAIPGNTRVADVARDAVREIAAELPDTALGARLLAEADGVHQIFTDFPLAKTRGFFDAPEKKGPGGALLAITVNPETCKGCMECVQVCGDDALRPTTQDETTIESLRRGWTTWKDLPDSDPAYVSIKDLDAAEGVLSSLLLKKANYYTNVGGDGACSGCGEKTPIHLFCAVAEALMQPRVKAHVARLQAGRTRILPGYTLSPWTRP